jgi:hypothetical protein
MAMRPTRWGDRTRSQKLAAVLYPAHVSAFVRSEMATLSANERKPPPQAPKLLSDRTRGAVSPLGGTARR